MRAGADAGFDAGDEPGTELAEAATGADSEGALVDGPVDAQAVVKVMAAIHADRKIRLTSSPAIRGLFGQAGSPPQLRK